MTHVRHIFSIVARVTHGEPLASIPVDWKSVSHDWHLAAMGALTVAQTLGAARAAKDLQQLCDRIDRELANLHDAQYPDTGDDDGPIIV